jgi:hypothetical protein
MANSMASTAESMLGSVAIWISPNSLYFFAYPGVSTEDVNRERSIPGHIEAERVYTQWLA